MSTSRLSGPPAAVRAVFDRLDTNRDGGIDQSERHALATRAGVDPRSENVAWLLDNWGHISDGFLAPGDLRVILRFFLANPRMEWHPPELTSAELRARALEWFIAADEDRSGALSSAEVLRHFGPDWSTDEVPRVLIEVLDADGNRQLDRSEAEAVLDDLTTPRRVRAGPPLPSGALEALAATARTKKSPLFAPQEPLPFTWSADFADIAARKVELKESGERVAAELTSGGASVPAELTVRGETSHWDLPFPKLKMKVGAGGASPFGSKEKIEVGVHGHVIGSEDRPPFSGMGRELGDYVPRREASAYAVLEELGLPVPAVRVGDTTYVDTKGDADPTNDVREAGHGTLLVESVDALARRWGGERLKSKDFPDEGLPIRLEDLALQEAAQALVGNGDFMVDPLESVDAGAALMFADAHNIKFVRLEDGWVRPVLEDFDLCAWTLTVGSDSAKFWTPENDHDFGAQLTHATRKLAPEQKLPFFERLLSRHEAVASRLAGFPLTEGDAQKAYLAARIERYFDAVRAKVDELRV